MQGRRRISLQEKIMALVMEPKFVWVLVVLGNFVAISLQASSRQSDTYVAAVVEYAPVSGATLDNKEQIFMQNVATYACFMEEAARQGADIIVFPEIGLASMGVPRNPDGTPSLAFYVPEPGSNPCNDNSSEISQGLRELSCAARRHGLYAVVNLPERVNCTGCPCPGFPATVDGEECPPSGAYFHNTNVAFDRTGTIVARYRKFNLFGEPGFVPTVEPEFAVFDTDFGVTFGTFICFDIMFEKPAVALAKDYGICDFAFPTAWFSEVPFLTAVQTQAAWAHSLDVNLLASGYNKPEVGSAGSGIFLGRNGALQSVMPNTTTSQMLVGSVPKMRRCQERAAARTRRAYPAGDGEDDENSGVERTPLSAFHHIVRQRKFGHTDWDVDETESAPAFIHHTMYDREGETAQNEDEFQPPSGEYETKVPPHFMGLQQADQGEFDEQNGEAAETSDAPCEEAGGEDWENEAQETVEGEISHSSSPYGDEQKVDIPEKRIPASTSTDPYGFSEPSQNPDLLRLYQEEPDEQLPEEFLEIEVPESFERAFEPEHEQEYFKLPDEEEIPPSDKIEEESRKVSDEEENQQLLKTDDSAAAPADSADLSVPLLEEKEEAEQKVVPTGNELETTYDGERNTTQDEIEAARKNFEWLIYDKDGTIPDDSSEQEGNVPSATSASKEDEEAPVEEHIDDTDDVLADDHGLHLLHDGGEEEEKPREDHVDDTDDVLADDHGLLELDSGHAPAESDTGPKQKADDSGELAEGSVADPLAEDQQPAESEVDLKKPAKRRKQRSTRRCRFRRSKRQRKCRARPEGQPSSEVADGITADDKPVVETPEYEAESADGKPVLETSDYEAESAVGKPVSETSEFEAEAVAGENEPEEQQSKADPEVASSKPKRPCKPRERRETGCPEFRDGVLDDPRVVKSTVGMFLKRDHLDVYKTFTLNTDSLIENSTVLLCDGTFCCNFHVVMEVNAELDEPRYAYRLAVFDGVRTFDGVATGGVQVCAVIPCSRHDMDSCGMLTLPDTAAYATVFRTISISGVFSTNHTLVTANTLVPGLEPLPTDRFNLTSVPQADKVARVTLKTTAAVQDQGVSLFTFAIYSRVFKRDGQPPTTLPGTAGGDGNGNS